MTGREGMDVEILRALTEKLPDDVLNRCLPAHDPASIRNCLRRASGRIAVQSAAPPDTGPTAAKGKTDDTRSRKSGKLLLFTDGASRGNPGEAGAGIQILDAGSREIFTSGVYLGQCTNNVAEYKALILGLTEARKIDDREIDVSLDSELIVRQIQGRYRVKHPDLKPLFAKVMKLLAAFKSYQVRHVPRAQNKRADELANKGIDQRLSTGA